MKIIIVIAALAGAVFFFLNQKKKNAAGQPGPNQKPGQGTGRLPSAEPASGKPDTELAQILDSLVKTNLLIRKDGTFPAGLTREIETVIDDLGTVIPAMMDRYPGEALTYEVKKIGLTHLFKTVKEYLDLSTQSRENQADMFKQTLSSLSQVTARSREIVEKNETAEFKTMANFLAGKFS